MDITDTIAFLLSVFFLFRGFSRGFMRSLLGPFSIIVATIISIIYYQITQDLVLSLVIGLIGPFILHLLLKFFLKMLAKATNTEVPPGFLSRLGGAILTLAWGWVFIILTLLLLTLLPPLGKTLASMRSDVTRSISYTIAKPLEDLLFASSKQNNAAVTSAAPNNDAKSLAEDPRFQKVLQDPEVQKEIDAHDMVKLMSNPKMMDLTREILSDPATMKKVMAVYQNQPQASSSTSASSK
jgi:uncharacterized membrane protein required for colicin V production